MRGWQGHDQGHLLANKTAVDAHWRNNREQIWDLLHQGFPKRKSDATKAARPATETLQVGTKSWYRWRWSYDFKDYSLLKTASGRSLKEELIDEQIKWQKILFEHRVQEIFSATDLYDHVGNPQDVGVFERASIGESKGFQVQRWVNEHCGPNNIRDQANHKDLHGFAKQFKEQIETAFDALNPVNVGAFNRDEDLPFSEAEGKYLRDLLAIEFRPRTPAQPSIDLTLNKKRARHLIEGGVEPRYTWARGQVTVAELLYSEDEQVLRGYFGRLVEGLCVHETRESYITALAEVGNLRAALWQTKLKCEEELNGVREKVAKQLNSELAFAKRKVKHDELQSRHAIRNGIPLFQRSRELYDRDHRAISRPDQHRPRVPHEDDTSRHSPLVTRQRIDLEELNGRLTESQHTLIDQKLRYLQESVLYQEAFASSNSLQLLSFKYALKLEKLLRSAAHFERNQDSPSTNVDLAKVSTAQNEHIRQLSDELARATLEIGNLKSEKQEAIKSGEQAQRIYGKVRRSYIPTQ
jgi:hypothetical protein